jgi:hypothetical protein
MAEQDLIRPMGPLQEGDQAIVDALQRLPAEASSVHSAPLEAVVSDFTGSRETTPGLPKDHWSVASVETDHDGNPERAEVTLVQVSPKDINVVLRGGSVADEIRTEEDKPKAIDRAKLHDSKTEQSIKLLTAERLNKAADTLLRIQGINNPS